MPHDPLVTRMAWQMSLSESYKGPSSHLCRQTPCMDGRDGEQKALLSKWAASGFQNKAVCKFARTHAFSFPFFPLRPLTV